MIEKLEVLRNVINALISIKQAEKLYSDDNNLLLRAKNDLKLLARNIIDNL